MGTAHEENEGRFNEAQINHLLASFRHVDGLLSSIERILECAQSQSPFPRYQLDVAPDMRSELEEQIRRLRALLVSILDRRQIPVPPPGIAASHAIATATDFIELAVDELRPKQMRAYGGLSEPAAAVLNGIVDELERMAVTMIRTAKNGRKQVA